MMRTIVLSIALALMACDPGPDPGSIRLKVIDTGTPTTSWETWDVGPVPTVPSPSYLAQDLQQCIFAPCQDTAIVDDLEDDYTLLIDTCVDCVGPGCQATGEVCTRGHTRLSDTIDVHWSWDGAAWVLDHAHWPTGPGRRYKIDGSLLPLPVPP